MHLFPFPTSSHAPCSAGSVGGHYNPTGADTSGNYSTRCSPSSPENCEQGDLGGKFGPLNTTTAMMEHTDAFLSLYGPRSIVGRSIVIHSEDGSRFVCANIGYPEADDSSAVILQSPFRKGFVGNVFFRQHAPGSKTASVYANLFRAGDSAGGAPSVGHSWDVHQRAAASDVFNCSGVGPLYNPLMGLGPSDPGYDANCTTERQTECAVGDLTGKGGLLPVDASNNSKLFYTDVYLPLKESMIGGGDVSIDNRSLVILQGEEDSNTLACAGVLPYRTLRAVARFNANGVEGYVRMTQDSLFDDTKVSVRLSGLQGIAGGYHIHDYPIGPDGVGSGEGCAPRFTGGHWNPRGIVYIDGEDLVTSDQYEFGDLSGKFGSLEDMNEIDATFSDPNIPLSGKDGVIGRSIVIHLHSDGSRWVCANIEHETEDMLVYSATFNDSLFRGRITFTQRANDPFSDTIITVETLEVPSVGGGASSTTTTTTAIVSTNFVTQAPPTPTVTPPINATMSSTESTAAPAATSLAQPAPSTSHVPTPSSTSHVPTPSSTSVDSTQLQMLPASPSIVATQTTPTSSAQTTPTNSAKTTPIPSIITPLDSSTPLDTMTASTTGTPTADTSSSVPATTTVEPQSTPMVRRRKRRGRGGEGGEGVGRGRREVSGVRFGWRLSMGGPSGPPNCAADAQVRSPFSRYVCTM